VRTRRATQTEQAENNVVLEIMGISTNWQSKWVQNQAYKPKTPRWRNLKGGLGKGTLGKRDGKEK